MACGLTVHFTQPAMARVVKSVVFNQKDRKNDIILLKSVTAENPFMDTKKWMTVANDLNDAVLPEKEATERTVRERVKLLLKNFRKDEAESMRKSGPAEAFDEFQRLLTEVNQLEEESVTEKNDQKKSNKSKAKADHQAAVSIRKRAFESMVESDSDDFSGSESEALEEPEENNNQTKKDKNAKKPKIHQVQKREDPVFKLLQKKMELEEKKEARKLKELEERREERKQNLELVRGAMMRQNAPHSDHDI